FCREQKMYVTHKTDTEPDAVAPPPGLDGACGRRQEPSDNANNDERTPSGAAEHPGLDAALTTVSAPVRAAGRRRRSTCRSGLARLEQSRYERNQQTGLRVLDAPVKSVGRAALAAQSPAPITVAVFAALPEERDILARELNFSRTG